MNYVIYETMQEAEEAKDKIASLMPKEIKNGIPRFFLLRITKIYDRFIVDFGFSDAISEMVKNGFANDRRRILQHGTKFQPEIYKANINSANIFRKCSSWLVSNQHKFGYDLRNNRAILCLAGNGLKKLQSESSKISHELKLQNRFIHMARNIEKQG